MNDNFVDTHCAVKILNQVQDDGGWLNDTGGTGDTWRTERLCGQGRPSSTAEPVM